MWPHLLGIVSGEHYGRFICIVADKHSSCGVGLHCFAAVCALRAMQTSPNKDNTNLFATGCSGNWLLWLSSGDMAYLSALTASAGADIVYVPSLYDSSL